MRGTRKNKIILTIIMIIFVMFIFNNDIVMAAINTSYSGTDSVPDTAMESAFDNSTLLKQIAKLIYAVGRAIEWITGAIFSLLTGYSDFPWADKIVFNSVPLLDVNFINPDARSFVGNTSIQMVLKNLYSTVLALAVSFFGIAVLITAIKLVISTIASEKAKYKQAIVDWLVGFVMLFCIHYFISFVFYLNEQLVVVASKIVSSQLSVIDEDTVKQAEMKADALMQELIDDVESRNVTFNGKKVADILKENLVLLSTWMNALDSEDDSKGLHEALMKEARWTRDFHLNTNKQYEALGMIITWAANKNVSVEELSKIKADIRVLRQPNTYENNQAIKEDHISKIFGPMSDEFTSRIDPDYFHEVIAIPANAWGTIIDDKYGYDFFLYETTSMGSGETTDMTHCRDTVGAAKTSKCKAERYYASRGASRFGDKWKTGSYKYNTSYYWTDVLDDLIILKGASPTSGGTTNKATRLISDLATYFRYNSYSKELRTTNVTGVKNTKNIQIQNMIMYAILVVQSLILFIAYIKRLFYVILLGMMGPVVVVFDFFQKFGK